MEKLKQVEFSNKKECEIFIEKCKTNDTTTCVPLFYINDITTCLQDPQKNNPGMKNFSESQIPPPPQKSQQTKKIEVYEQPKQNSLATDFKKRRSPDDQADTLIKKNKKRVKRAPLINYDKKKLVTEIIELFEFIDLQKEQNIKSEKSETSNKLNKEITEIDGQINKWEDAFKSSGTEFVKLMNQNEYSNSNGNYCDYDDDDGYQRHKPMTNKLTLKKLKAYYKLDHLQIIEEEDGSDDEKTSYANYGNENYN